jgi:hypothetical protein
MQQTRFCNHEAAAPIRHIPSPTILIAPAEVPDGKSASFSFSTFRFFSAFP